MSTIPPVNKIELEAEPSQFHPGSWHAVIRRNGNMSYSSQKHFPTPDAAQRYAAQVFTGEVSGYRY